MSRTQRVAGQSDKCTGEDVRCDGEQAGADGWEHLFGSRPDYTVMYTVFSALMVWSSPGVAKTARAHARTRFTPTP